MATRPICSDFGTTGKFTGDWLDHPNPEYRHVFTNATDASKHLQAVQALEIQHRLCPMPSSLMKCSEVGQNAFCKDPCGTLICGCAPNICKREGPLADTEDTSSFNLKFGCHATAGASMNSAQPALIGALTMTASTTRRLPTRALNSSPRSTAKFSSPTAATSGPGTPKASISAAPDACLLSRPQH